MLINKKDRSQDLSFFTYLFLSHFPAIVQPLQFPQQPLPFFFCFKILATAAITSRIIITIRITS